VKAQALKQDEYQEIPLPQVLLSEALTGPQDYRLNGYHQWVTKIGSEDINATGYGDGETQATARAKAYSEAVERFALFYTPRLGISAANSNGWACHYSAAVASQIAVCELIERHVALSLWFSGGPYLEIPPSLWPEPVREWSAARSEKLEFPNLKLLLCKSPVGCAITALLFNEKGNFVSGHASAISLEDAILSAAKECLSAARLAVSLEFFGEVMKIHEPENAGGHQFQPAANALAYAYTKTLPTEISFITADDKTVIELWRDQHQKVLKLQESSSIMVWRCGDRYIAYATSEKVKNIFWGPTPKEMNVKNNNPHIVG
jgi:ribosomal protein S12 methylthiotransferase accessory factor YcaO